MNSTAVRILGALAALQLLLGGVAVATIDDETELPTEGALRGTDQASQTTTPGPDAGPSPTAGPSGASGPAAGSPAAGARDGSGPSSVGTPPRAGRYRFRGDNSGTMGFGASTTEFSGEQEYDERYEHVAGPPGQTIVRQMVDDPEHGDEVEFSGYTEYGWNAAGNHLRTELHVFSRSENGGPPKEERRECNWEPDVPVLQFPMRTGHAWSWESSCTTREDDSESTDTRRGKSEITGTRAVEVGGRAFSGWVLQTNETRDIVTTFATPGHPQGERQTVRQRITSTATQVFVPTVGLVAHSEAEYSQESDGFGGDGGSRGKGRGTTVLLTPDPS